MVEPWLVYFLIFAAVFMAVHFAFRYFGQELKIQRKVNQRFSGLDFGRYQERQIEVIKRRASSQFFSRGRLGSLDLLITQSGLPLGLAHLAGAAVAVGAILYFVLSGIPWAPLRVLVSVGLACSAVLMALRLVRAKRIAKFAEQLPDVIDIIVRSLKAGHPLPVSISLVAREMPDPAGKEFALTYDEIAYGRELKDALENLHHRVGYLDLQFLVTSISVSHQTGGNLGEILARLSKLLRDRFRMKRKVKSLSSEGRFSAVALSIFPFVMFAIINVIGPQFYSEVWDHPLITLAAMLSGALLLIGNIVMYKMVNFKF
jgi:tight adherence protein B